MTFSAFVLLYSLIGAGIGSAAYVTLPLRGTVPRMSQLLGAVAFWPLFLPLLLSRPAEAVLPTAGARDDLARASARAKAELEEALHSLDGWAEDVLERERGRLAELRSVWLLQAQRVREMDHLLRKPDIASQ